jgi:hypothetical protein
MQCMPCRCVVLCLNGSLVNVGGLYRCISNTFCTHTFLSYTVDWNDYPKYLLHWHIPIIYILLCSGVLFMTFHNGLPASPCHMQYILQFATHVCIAGVILDAILLARSQYSEGPATGHLDTGFPWFPCVYKQMLRWLPRFQVATTCFSCSPPDLKLNVSVTSFIFLLHVK